MHGGFSGFLDEPVTSGVTQNLSGIAYGEHEYVCVGQAGTILTSTNGSDWRIVPSGVTNDLNAVAFDKGTSTWLEPPG